MRPCAARCSSSSGPSPDPLGRRRCAAPSVVRRLVELQVVALAVLERRDASPGMVGDLGRYLDALLLQIVHGLLEATLGPKGYDGAARATRPGGLAPAQGDA